MNAYGRYILCELLRQSSLQKPAIKPQEETPKKKPIKHETVNIEPLVEEPEIAKVEEEEFNVARRKYRNKK